jgi:TRAP transporter TAXI family solute receptor
MAQRTSRPISVLTAVLTLVTALALAGAGVPAVAQPKTTLVFSSGPTGGSWIPLAATTADIVKKRFPDLDVQVEPGAALVNMEKIRSDKADLGWSMTTVLSDARAGTGQWQGKQTERPLYVANMYPNVWQLVVTADSDIRTLADLKGKAVALPPRGNTSLSDGWVNLLALDGLKLGDLSVSYGSLAENVELIKNRQAVAMGWFTTVPASFIRDLGSAIRIRMLPVPDDIVAKMRGINAGFARHVIPAGTYKEQGIDGEIVTFQAPTILIASSKTPEDVVYRLTKAIVEGREQYGAVFAAMKGITPKELGQDFGMPYHPGAARYYKEIGVLR